MTLETCSEIGLELMERLCFFASLPPAHTAQKEGGGATITSYPISLHVDIFTPLYLKTSKQLSAHLFPGPSLLIKLPGEIKHYPEIVKTAIQPEPAQTADLSISGSRFISSLCTYATRTLYLDGTQAISPHFRSRRTMTKNDTGHHPGVESGSSGLICDSEVARPPLQTV